jgi:hypothetical protein
MAYARRSLGDVNASTTGTFGSLDWLFVVGSLLFGSWLVTAHWKH